MSRLPPHEFRRGLAVVTGAASGIGEQLAHQLAGRGSHLHLVDRDEAGLTRVAASIGEQHSGIAVRTSVFDLEAVDEIPRLAEAVVAHGAPTLLVNNAGVGLGGEFRQLDLQEFDSVLRINFRAAVGLTHALLPALLRSPGGHIVNLSSVFGLVTPPSQSAYVASKFALRGFSDVLRTELHDHGVGVTTVYPAGVRTMIAVNSRRARSLPRQQFEADRDRLAAHLTYPPERAASEILRAVERRRPRVLITRTAHVLDLLARLAPAGQADVIRRLFKYRRADGGGVDAARRLVTYGTLAPGRPNHHQLAGLEGRWLPGAVTGTLVPSGWGAELGFPALVLDPDAPEVEVQLFESPDLPGHWSRLDDFEGPGYERVLTTVRTERGLLEASIYVHKPATSA